ncbi:MAG: type I glyceraldehyde-3-phosphate dehydrogenase [Candidatus Vogelbacteria bacterium]|nr:type I glyceraldehyde-3-phosphate dehydrogenase [Candidatus Vogelbacteria bacterium]
MSIVRVSINGLGRIGRAFLKLAIINPDLEVVAVNDLATLENLAYLLKYDSAYGHSGLEVVVGDGALIINGKSIKVLSEKDPAKLPWQNLKVDVVVESTGIFEEYTKAKAHLDAGARKVVITAPAKGESVAGVQSGTVLMGINEANLATCQISSNGSCTTNSASPLIQILDEAIGIDKAILNTVHGYTASQRLVDGPDVKDFRRGRAAAVNIVPSTTGAAIAVTEAITQLAGKFDGVAIRVPVVTGSIVDVTFITKRPTTVVEINNALQQAASAPRWQKWFAVTNEPLVSSDIVGNPYASLVDLNLTRVVGGNLVKVLAWYDNELGYTHTLIDHVIKTGQI